MRAPGQRGLHIVLQRSQNDKSSGGGLWLPSVPGTWQSMSDNVMADAIAACNAW